MTSYHWLRPLAARKRKIYTCALGAALVMGVALPALAVAAGLVTTPLSASAQSADGEQVGSMTAPKDLGRVVSDQAQTISVYLNLHDQAGFDQAVSALYDPASSTFHHWFTDSDFAKYAPTAAELQTVRAELERQGLETVSVDPLNFSLRVRGNTAAIESAFHTELHTISYGKSLVQTPMSEPKLAGSAGDLVAATVGVERHQVQPQFAIAKNPLTGEPLFEKALSKAQSPAGIFGDSITGTALAAPQTVLMTTPGAPLPTATYSGPLYDNNPTAVVSYTPSQLQRHYGLTSLVRQGYDGRGQTIALVEGFGYAAAEADANLAASAFGLPPLNSKNFQVIYPEGQPASPNAADLTGWTTEIALDIQSAHAIAPGATIVEVASDGQDNEDFIAAIEYIIAHRVATIVSDSWETDAEITSGTPEEQAFNTVLERSAAAGIAVQFSSGDSGDQGLDTPLGAVSVPSNSPFVTAVGGTSVLNDPLANSDLTGRDIVTGWGTAVAVLADSSSGVEDPPEDLGFQSGAGGGESLYYSKPSWQRNLPGKGRQVPDVSALADPQTGFPVVATVGGVQNAIAGVGGTSLASPLFSGIWAIAQQYNHETLGQAAPTIARLRPGQITDVVDTSDLTPHNTSGTITDSNGATFYTPLDIFAGAIETIPQTNYLVAIVPQGDGAWAALAFGADTSLTVEPGWDNVTGYGEPNGLPFIQAVGSRHQIFDTLGAAQ
jgi:subtilase family serine protease